MPKKITTSITVLSICLVAAYLFGYNPSFVFSTKTKMVIHPTEEWELVRTIDGNLISIQKNHIKNYVNSYAVTEFQRGDAVKFVLNPKIFDQKTINKGDTIGYVFSNEEQRRLIQLKGELGVLIAELEFHTTGQKPEDVEFASRNLALAMQELETQRKLMARSEALISDLVISKEQYDIDLNALKVKELSVELARANLASIDTGEKPEMEKLIRSKIEALNNEINQIQNRLDLLTVVSPISGTLSIDHNSLMTIPLNENVETIVKIMNTEKPIGLMPIRVTHRSAINAGAEVKLRKHENKGRVVLINNIAQISIGSPYIYYVVQLEKNLNYTFGESQDVIVVGSEIPFREFLTLHLTH